MDKAIKLSADNEVPMVKNVFTFIEDQELWGYVVSFVSLLFKLIIDTYHFWNFIR